MDGFGEISPGHWVYCVQVCLGWWNSCKDKRHVCPTDPPGRTPPGTEMQIEDLRHHQSSKELLLLERRIYRYSTVTSSGYNLLTLCFLHRSAASEQSLATGETLPGLRTGSPPDLTCQSWVDLVSHYERGRETLRKWCDWTEASYLFT